MSLKRRTLAHYSLPALPLGFMGGLVSLYLLKFATDVLLVAPALIAGAFALAKVWDAVSDPMVGYLSDRSSGRRGRRRPWVLASIVPLALSFASLWAPPSGLGPGRLEIWVCVAVFLFYTTYTTANVPHLAWGAELSDDYHERTRIFGSRGLAQLCGTLLAVAAIAALQTAPDERVHAAGMVWVYVLVGSAAILFGALRLPERREFRGRGAHTPGGAISDVARNRLARILLAVFFLETLSMSCLGTLFPYVGDYLAPGGGISATYLGLALGTALLAFPAWIALSRRFGKRDPWLAALALKACGFAGLYFVGPGTEWLVGSMTVLVGLGQGCSIAVPAAIKADVIDVDELQTGQRKEGVYFAGWNFVEKLAAGVSIAIVGALLQLSGYEANAAQSEGALRAIRLLFSAFPLALHGIAIALLLRFDLTEAEHGRVREQIDARRAGA